MCQLRNPWGKYEWKGRWSDNDKVWTPKLESILNYKRDSNDGVFFMEFNDFKENFGRVDICHYKDDY